MSGCSSTTASARFSPARRRDRCHALGVGLDRGRPRSNLWQLLLLVVLLALGTVAARLIRERRSGGAGSRAAPAAGTQRAGRLPLVDSLRAIAAVSVLLTHASLLSGLDSSASLGPYARRLDVGVAIFFLISGLLLYRPFVLARLQGRPAPAAGPYAWRRFLRIAPAYWVALTVTVLVVGTPSFTPGVFTMSGIPRYYLFGQDFASNSISGGLVQAWTLTIEVSFYIFLPAYAWLQARTSTKRLRRAVSIEVLGLVALVVISEVWKSVALAGRSHSNPGITPWLYSMPAFLDQFALGMGLALLSAWIHVRRRDPRWVATFDRAPTAAWVFAAIAFWLVSRQVAPWTVPFWRWTPIQYMERQWLYGLVAVGLLLPAVVGDQTRGVARRILANPVLVWLGLISYGIYLWQLTVMKEMSDLGFGPHARDLIHPYIGWPLASLVLTAAVAAASYYAIERPALSLKRAFDKRTGGPARNAPLAAAAPATPAPRSGAR